MSIKRAALITLSVSLLPATAAFAQTLDGPRVKVNREKVDVVSGHVAKSWLVTTAARGTVLDVIHVDGDPNQYRESNWYWVLLPRDEWGTQRAGWVSGRDVDPYPSAQMAAAARPVADSRSAGVTGPATVEAGPAARSAMNVAAAAPRPAALPSATTAAPAPAPAEVSSVVHFAFNKSELSDEAKTSLADAVATLKAGAASASVSLEGHADWVGSESYNDALGMARAEAVRQYLQTAQGVPTGQISVVSRGEKDPAAPNSTAEGRVENRRVVIKVVAPK